MCVAFGTLYLGFGNLYSRGGRRDYYYLRWGGLDTLVNAIIPIDRNALVNSVLDKRNQLAAQINTEDAIDEAEGEIIESCLIPLIDCFLKMVCDAPVVRAFEDSDYVGYWEHVVGFKVKCSVCQKEAYGLDLHYCPHCGSRMEEKQDVLARLQ